MTRTLEDYWTELHNRWLAHAFPFSRETFQRIVRDIVEEDYTPPEAIVKHIAEGSGIEPAEFGRLMKERLGGRLRPEDGLELVEGYGRLTMLLQAGFFYAVEGPAATQEIMRQWRLTLRRERVDFLAENLERAAALIVQDPTGRAMMTQCADSMTRGSRRMFYNEGVRTALETFMAYSRCWEEFAKGDVS
jgi:hypothetical protein